MLDRFAHGLASLLILSSAPLSADMTEDLSQLSEDHTQFAFSLYPEIDTSDENLVFSPYSISTCLSMVYLGARAETAAQMQKALHLEIDRKNIAKTSSSMTQSLLPAKSDEKSYKLNIANAVWVDQGTFLLADFRYALEEQFKAKLGKINFSITQDALSTINNWVSQQTQGKITNLLTPQDIDAQTRLVLTNSVYFQGNWSSPFNAKSTQDWPFHPTPDTSTTVKMMQQALTIPYYENDLLQAAALPFMGDTAGKGNFAFFFLLPKSADNFTVMVNELSDGFDDWLSSLSPQRIDLKLPKFTLNTRYDLNAPLQKLGMEDAFDADANFAGIDGLRDLFINKVVHQAFFALDENGVTAAAATGASMSMKSAVPAPPMIAMTADHPFLFFIVDLQSQEILFMGKVAQPNGSQ